jgi:hypothetical protein
MGKGADRQAAVPDRHGGRLAIRENTSVNPQNPI